MSTQSHYPSNTHSNSLAGNKSSHSLLPRSHSSTSIRRPTQQRPQSSTHLSSSAKSTSIQQIHQIKSHSYNHNDKRFSRNFTNNLDYYEDLDDSAVGFNPDEDSKILFVRNEYLTDTSHEIEDHHLDPTQNPWLFEPEFVDYILKKKQSKPGPEREPVNLDDKPSKSKKNVQYEYNELKYNPKLHKDFIGVHSIDTNYKNIRSTASSTKIEIMQSLNLKVDKYKKKVETYIDNNKSVICKYSFNLMIDAIALFGKRGLMLDRLPYVQIETQYNSSTSTSASTNAAHSKVYTFEYKAGNGEVYKRHLLESACPTLEPTEWISLVNSLLRAMMTFKLISPMQLDAIKSKMHSMKRFQLNNSSSVKHSKNYLERNKEIVRNLSNSRTNSRLQNQNQDNLDSMASKDSDKSQDVHESNVNSLNKIDFSNSNLNNAQNTVNLVENTLKSNYKEETKVNETKVNHPNKCYVISELKEDCISKSVKKYLFKNSHELKHLSRVKQRGILLYESIKYSTKEYHANNLKELKSITERVFRLIKHDSEKEDFQPFLNYCLNALFIDELILKNEYFSGRPNSDISVSDSVKFSLDEVKDELTSMSLHLTDPLDSKYENRLKYFKLILINQLDMDYLLKKYDKTDFYNILKILYNLDVMHQKNQYNLHKTIMEESAKKESHLRELEQDNLNK